MSYWQFLKGCWEIAWTGAWGLLGTLSTVFGILIPLIAFYVKQSSSEERIASYLDRVVSAVNFPDYVWIVPSILALAFLATRLFLVAPYSLLKNEEERAGKAERATAGLEAELQAQSRVDLSLRFDSYVFADTDKGHALIAFITIHNRGTETALEGWGLTITTPSNVIWSRQPTLFTDPLRIADGAFTLADHLVTKTSSPVARGSITKGILFYELDAFAGSLVKSGSRLSIQAEDVRGGKHSVEQIMHGPTKQDLVFTFAPSGRLDQLP